MKKKTLILEVDYNLIGPQYFYNLFGEIIDYHLPGRH